MILFEWHLSIIFLLIWKWYYPLLINTNNDTLWMLHLYLSLYSSICICICIPPCFNLFSTSLLRQRSNFIYERGLISRRADSLELIHNSIWRWHRSASVFALQDLGLCRFDLLRFYFIARSWFIRLNFFQPSRYINQGPIIETSFQKSATKETTEDASFTWASFHIENSSGQLEAFSQGWWSASQQCWQTLPF